MNSLDYLFEKVNQVVEEVKEENRGRSKKRKQGGQPLSDKKAIETVLMDLLGTVKGWGLRQLHRQLTTFRQPRWRNLCGVRWTDLPARSTLSWRRKQPNFKSWRKRIYKRMLKTLLNCKNLALLAVDMTDVNSRFKDDLADGGFCSKGYFYGYKLHLIVTRDGVPLTTVLTKANLTEASVNDKLTDKLDRSLTKKQRERLRKVVADAGYDSNRIYEDFQESDMEMIAAVNPRRDGRLKEKKLSRKTKRELKERGKPRDLGILRYHTQRGKELYKERTVVERVFSQLKTHLLPRGSNGKSEKMPWWARGKRKVKEVVDRGLFAYVAMEYTNKLRRKKIRKITPYLC